jgi:hypothetical protein
MAGTFPERSGGTGNGGAVIEELHEGDPRRDQALVETNDGWRSLALVSGDDAVHNADVGDDFWWRRS